MFPDLVQLNKIAKTTGHVNVGGAPDNPGHSVDYCAFHHSGIGTKDALFDSDFHQELLHRDFTCNAVYYDHINRIVIDPSGTGLSDIQSRTLNGVWDAQYVSPHGLGKIVIRFFKFRLLGYKASAACESAILTDLKTRLRAIKPAARSAYVRRQIIRRFADPPTRTVDRLKTMFCSYGLRDAWSEFLVHRRRDALQHSAV
jgi:hypothetical protein